MKKKIVFGTFASALVMFVWGWFYWTVLPMPLGVWQQPTTAEQVALNEELTKHLKNDGVYFLPTPEEGVDDESDPNSPVFKRYKDGPLVEIYYRKAGADPMDPSRFVFGFLHVFVASLMLACLLAAFRNSLCCYGARVALVAGIGTFAGFWMELSRPIWFHHPVGHALFSMGYQISVWLIGGAILGVIVKLKKPKAESQPGGT